MTRENKVALVVGFAFVLLVGILISDHLSKAQTQRPANLVPVSNRRETSARAAADLIDLRYRPERPAAQQALAGGAAGRSSRPAVVLPAPESPAPATAPRANAPREHRVQPGESMSEICLRHYGTIALTRELARYNDLADPNAVRAGARLVLPPADVLSGEAPDAEPGGGAMTTYTVRPGDTLSRIAERFLPGGDWRRLHELNRDVISDPDDIRAGMLLRLPAG